jgi:hypothetical protein
MGLLVFLLLQEPYLRVMQVLPENYKSQFRDEFTKRVSEQHLCARDKAASVWLSAAAEHLRKQT